MMPILPLLLALAAAPPCPRGADVAFINVDVLTMKDSAVTRNQTVLVRNGSIAAIGQTKPPKGVCIVDGRGKVLLPGLADMHVHTNERELPLFLANGVTLVREMNGTPGHIALRERLAKGELPGPRMLVTSPLLVGAQLRYRHRLVTSAEDAYAAAHEAKDNGFDYLKIYDGLTPESYAALVESGRTLGLPLDGHVPESVGLENVIAAGQSIQHMDKIAFALRGLANDSMKLAEARRLFSTRRIWVTPTLASLRALDAAGTTEYAARLERPEMMHVDSGSFAWWRSLRRDGTRTYAPSRIYQLEIALVRMLRDVGTPLLLGTDAANPLMIAGYSVHDEMDALRDAGLDPYYVLEMATRNVGRFLNDPRTGVIEVGARADLLLVDGNPLNNLATLRRPAGLMVGGRWLERAELEKLRDTVRR